MRWRPGIIAAAACLVAGGRAWGGAPRAPASAAPPRAAALAAALPAIWRTYDMIVNFQDLPRTYTCDQLWYAFHGILLRLGAPPPGVNILPYDCSPSPSGDLKSPRVEIRFQLPFLLQPGVKGAPIEAGPGSVVLAAGKPDTLHPADCDLLQQIAQTMLASMPVKVADEHFDCSAPPSRAGHFSVTVRLPVVAGTRAAEAPSAERAPR